MLLSYKTFSKQAVVFTVKQSQLTYDRNTTVVVKLKIKG